MRGKERVENMKESDPGSHFSLDALEVLSGTNDDDDRKLWFDYVKTLNERQLQALQRSGVTNYVLLGTLVGLLYRFGPRIPQFLEQPDNVRMGLTVFALLAVVLSSVLIGVIGLGSYLGGEGDFRAVPKSSEHYFPFLYGMVLFVFAAFISFEVWVGISRSGNFQEYLLLPHGLWLTLQTVFSILLYRAR
jgi:hypothetical protein